MLPGVGMKRTQWYIGAPNGVVLCVDHICGRQLSGRSYHAYSCESENFHSMDEAVFQLEQLYDSLNFPRRTTVTRTFAGEGSRVRSGRERTRIMADEELLERHGDLGTFIIRVQHRQNSSWQGRITWMEKNQTVSFRSIWEMVKLVAEALDTVSGQEDAKEPCWTEEEQMGPDISE